MIRPPVKYHGGKYYLCRWIIENLPPHEVYIEVFGGAASVLLNKEPAAQEVYNDAEYSIYNLFRILKENGPELIAELRKIPYTKEQYLEFREIYREGMPGLDPLQQAVITYSVRRMSRGGLCGTFCWSSRIYGDGVPGEVHSWNTMLDELPKISSRLQNVTITNLDWRMVLSEYSGPEVLFYLDPPYPTSTRVFKKAYVMEMTQEDHVSLLTALVKKEARVAVSSYPSPLYNEMLSNWTCLRKEIVNHSSHEKKKDEKTEALWVI